VPVITAIVPAGAQGTRFSLVVDGSEAAVVSIETIERLGLSVGGSWEDVRVAVEHDAAKLHTYDRALNLLAASPRSAKELRRRLVLKGEPPELADLAIQRLLDLGLLNDADYARQIARSKATSQGHSRRRLQQELFKRGVQRDVADAAISDVMEDETIDSEAIIEKIARRKARSLAKLEPAARRRRLYDFLARRGYDHDDIQRAIATVMAEPLDDGGVSEDPHEDRDD
jgi:regulatory protein